MRCIMQAARWTVLLTLPAWLSAAPAVAQVTAILAGRVADPETAAVLANQVILVEDGKITRIGAAIPIPQTATRVDLSGRTVLAGLIDAHTHLCATVDAKWDLGDFWIMALQRRAGFRAIGGVRHAREMLDSGFTTVRDLGNAGDYLDMDLKKSIAFGIVPGPTMIAAGRIIAPFGGQFWDTPADGRLLDNPEYRFADSRDEMRKAIRENIYWGAGVIKIVVDSKAYTYAAEDIAFMVEEAGRAGRRVAAHAQTRAGARAAIEAKVASVEHGWVLEDEDLALAKKNGVVLVSTDFTVEELLANGMDEAAAKRTHDRYVARLRRAYAAGVEIVFGSDIMANVKGRTRGEVALGYLDSFREAGVPAPEILRAMTVRAARLLGIERERGSLRPGLAADIIAMPGNPLEDIYALRRVDFVMQNGRIHIRK